MNLPEASLPAETLSVEVTTYQEKTSARVELVVSSDMIDLGC